MRLDGPPGPSVRLMVGRSTVTPVVSGVFPPENAPRIRVVGEVMAALMRPEVPAMWEEAQARALDMALYGHSTITDPRGLFG